MNLIPQTSFAALARAYKRDVKIFHEQLPELKTNYRRTITQRERKLRENFETLLKTCPFFSAPTRQNLVVAGKLLHKEENYLLFDFGWKFYGSAITERFSPFEVGQDVYLLLKNTEMTGKFGDDSEFSSCQANVIPLKLKPLPIQERDESSPVTTHVTPTIYDSEEDMFADTESGNEQSIEVDDNTDDFSFVDADDTLTVTAEKDTSKNKDMKTEILENFIAKVGDKTESLEESGNVIIEGVLKKSKDIILGQSPTTDSSSFDEESEKSKSTESVSKSNQNIILDQSPTIDNSSLDENSKSTANVSKPNQDIIPCQSPTTDNLNVVSVDKKSAKSKSTKDVLKKSQDDDKKE